MNLQFQYSPWLLVVCLLAGATYAAVLYYRDTTFNEQSALLNKVLAPLRFLLVSLVAALLLAPFFRNVVNEQKKPVVVLAQDQSESILANMSSDDSTAYVGQISALRDALSSEYELVEYAFGSEIRSPIDFLFTDKETNISALLREVYDLYSNQNLGAVILASDGIYNQGSSPLYSSTRLNVPIYSIALGDTTLKKDLAISKVYHNKIAYLGDRFAIQVDVTARNAAGNSTTLTVSKVNGRATQRLEQQRLNIDQNDYFYTQEIILDANKSGVQRYRISLSPIADESSTANNVQDIFIDVLDARQKILLLGHSPHPDISAIKQSIESNQNYTVDVAYINQKLPEFKAYDLVILHQLPSKTQSINNILSTLNSNKIARWFIVGAQSSLNAINQAQELIDINGDGRNVDEVQALIQPAFPLFKLDDDLKTALPGFNPLIAPFANYKTSAEANVLLSQKIGAIETDKPLLLFGETQGAKTGVLTSEGIWRWRLFDYLEHQNHDRFNSLIGSTIQYLTIKEDKRKFRINVAKNIFKENERIVLDAELYNNSYELINEPDVSLTITNEEGQDFTYTFSKTENAYSLDAGFFPVGNYRFSGKTVAGGKEYTYNGQFSIQPIQLEIFETTADHQLLRMLSEQFGGELVYTAQIGEIPTRIQESGNVAPVLYSTTKTRSIINLRWIFFVLLALLSIEWFARKYFGGY
ncbi:MAG: hypothetical protein AAF598_13355 [Bacteroidota bacterium]